MSTPKFKRVAENVTPQYVEEQFFGAQSSMHEDIFAELRSGQAQRIAHIQRETLDGVSGTSEIEQPWAKVAEAAKLATPRFSVDDAYSTMPGTIRRAGYDVDDVNEGFQPNPSQFYNANDEYAMLSRGASIWDPNLEAITWDVAKADAQKKLMLERRAGLSDSKSRHTQWETEKQQEIVERRSGRAYHPLLGRRPEIMRTANEQTTDGRFGLPDFDAVMAHEEQRLRLAEMELNKKKAIKPNGRTPDERRAEWQLVSKASTFQDYGSWTDRMLDEEG